MIRTLATSSHPSRVDDAQLDRSILFALDPLPDDRWAILVNEGASRQFRDLLIGADAGTGRTDASRAMIGFGRGPDVG